MSSQEPSPASSSSAPATVKGKGRPRGSHGDSLIKRSREVLGLDRVRDIQRKKKSARDDNDPATKTTDRREQVREAQRTHRLRTKVYIKELETEVLRLRKSEAAATAYAAEMAKRCATLEEALRASGVEVPQQGGTPSLRTLSVSEASGPISQSLVEPRIVVDAANSNQTGPEHGGYASIQLLPDSGHLSLVPTLFSPDRSDPQVSAVFLRDNDPFPFNDAQAELDFILTLERPCMAHLHMSHFGSYPQHFDPSTFFSPGSHAVEPGDLVAEGDEGTPGKPLFSGHVLTMSMPLWQKVTADGPLDTQPARVRNELDVLLQRSFQLGLKNEIAPVQVLELIRTRAGQGGRVITLGALTRFAHDMAPHLKCYGFGAVFDSEIVRHLIGQYC